MTTSTSARALAELVAERDKPAEIYEDQGDGSKLFDGYVCNGCGAMVDSKEDVTVDSVNVLVVGHEEGCTWFAARNFLDEIGDEDDQHQKLAALYTECELAVREALPSEEVKANAPHFMDAIKMLIADRDEARAEVERLRAYASDPQHPIAYGMAIAHWQGEARRIEQDRDAALAECNRYAKAEEDFHAWRESFDADTDLPSRDQLRAAWDRCRRAERVRDALRAVHHQVTAGIVAQAVDAALVAAESRVGPWPEHILAAARAAGVSFAVAPLPEEPEVLEEDEADEENEDHADLPRLYDQGYADGCGDPGAVKLRARVRELEAEPRDEKVTKELEEAAEHWEKLIASAGNVCTYCRKPFSVEEMKVHVRSCEESPLAAELKELRKMLDGAKTAIESLVDEVHTAYGESEDYAELVGRIEGMLGAGGGRPG